MGTIDFARGRDNPAMVPVFTLCLLLPALVASAGHEGGGDMMHNMEQMMQMMQMANMMKGWGWGGEEKKEEEKAKEWYNAQNSEDYEAYLKWCEENKARQSEQKRQQELLDMFKAREAKRKEEMEKERMEDEKEERERAMMAQWKNWEKQLEYTSEFAELSMEIAEEKMEYYKMILNEFLKFCKCNDYNDQITAFFSKEGSAKKYAEWDITDLGLDEAQSTDPVAVARAVLPLDDQARVKNFFYGLAMAMCEGARSYYDKIHDWERDYKFLENLS